MRKHQHPEDEFFSKVECVQAPVDLPYAVKRFLRHWKPSALVILEADLWPNMLYECKQRGIRLIMVDGRISHMSAARWSFFLFRPLISYMFRMFETILCQSQQDSERMRALGAERLTCLGSLKLVAPISSVVQSEVDEIHKRLSYRIGDTRRTRKIWIAASTHEGEEEVAIEAHLDVASKLQCPADAHGKELKPLLVLVPRHPMRCDQILTVIQNRFPQLKLSLQSKDGMSMLLEADLHIVDMLGVLRVWYAVAPVALVGGSLVDGVGGHNVMEPALLGCFPLHGPHNQNGQHAIDVIAGSSPHCIRQVSDSRDLAESIREILKQDEKVLAELKDTVRSEMNSIAAKQGARIVEALTPYI
ncbi:hypothetical protein GUITHDRAFT_108138 [Guillardia theta CCMP2712]|uniref:3-deoxy-D-manno-octulosonic-acid transferase N-terminal domain-containing protein n=1 Tax=Guillardia theta (strain CCMP2712) TaxID=905079 RepID=L1JC26_GUITC|nr:hypothetical protein GUITHDRAFT_108138 [Guillardia theta CCMP2712]EKX46103.1 hypothetical protein GUITHDRAFT_108138 [Guillardia theta CCMP2712]|eukprot:XP_005833083.1 hypothetical protein GUITHDRAFT_108138 [Guillardia theta CCMP2712]